MVLRRCCFTFKLDFVDKGVFSGRCFWGFGGSFLWYSTELLRAVELRPYQEECIAKCLAEYSNGVRRQAVSLPVGSGKTVVFANLIAQLKPPTPSATRVLVLAHREELLAQAERQIKRVGPHLKCSMEKGKHRSKPDDDVILASVPTLGRAHAVNRLSRLDPAQFKAIIIDEAHHSVADTYLRIFRHFKVIDDLDANPSQEYQVGGDSRDAMPESSAASSKTNVSSLPGSHLLVWGCSATLSRNDERFLGKVFEKIVYHKDMKSMMDEGWLCPAETKEVFTDVDLQNVKFRGGDFEPSQLSLAIDTPARNDLVAGTWLKIAKEQCDRKATIVFALNVRHAENLAESFGKLGVRTAIITGKTADAQRVDTLARFAEGDIPILLNCAVLTEGTDLPITDCVVMTRPTCNSNLYIQMVGRGLRKHPGKQFCLVLDFIDKMFSRNRTLISFPSLIAEKEAFDSKGAGEEECPQSKAAKAAAKEINVDLVTVRVRSRSQEDVLKAGNPGHGLAWVYLDTHNFALASPKGAFLLEVHSENPSLGKLSAIHKVKPYEKNRRVQFLQLPLSKAWIPMTELVEALQKDLMEKGLLHHFRNDSFWRTQLPASAQQKAFLMQILAKIPGISSQHSRIVHQWSAGRAADFITKYQLRTRLLKKPFEDFDDFILGISGR